MAVRLNFFPKGLLESPGGLTEGQSLPNWRYRNIIITLRSINIKISVPKYLWG